jgi:predicted transcriptional regulator of viral defense system
MLAAVLACGPGAVLSHTSAAALHGLREEGPRTHVTVRRPGPHSSERIVVHRTRRLDPADVTSIDGIRVTTIARTTLDLAALGIETLRVTWRMVTDQEADLARTLGARTFATV